VQCRQGVTRAETVKAALAAYVADCATVKGKANAADARYCCASICGDSATAYGRTFGAIRLDKLRVLDVKNFRDALLDGRSKATVNRIMHRVKAGLNYAHRNQMAASDNAWKLVPAYPNADKRREIYLTVPHRRAILKQCSAPLADFLTAIMHTGARAGEIARATVGDYGRRDRTLRLVNHKGRGGEPRVRHVGLTDQAVALIEKHAKLRMPGLPLFENECGRPWNSKHWSEQLREAVAATRKTGVELPAGRIVATCLRHSTITDWVRAGMNPGDVARTVGTSITKIDSNYFQGRDTSAIREAIRVV
jgi:integrase